MNKITPHFLDDLHGLTKHISTGFYLPHLQEASFQTVSKDHEFIAEPHHGIIVDSLKKLAKNHPHAARELANELLKICARVISSPEHTMHHENARILSENIQKIHAEICGIISQGNHQLPWEIAGDIGSEDDLRRSAHRDVIGKIHSIITELKETGAHILQTITPQPQPTAWKLNGFIPVHAANQGRFGGGLTLVNAEEPIAANG